MNPRCIECRKPLSQDTWCVTNGKGGDRRPWKTREEAQQAADAHAGRPVTIVSYRKQWGRTDSGKTKMVEAEKVGLYSLPPDEMVEVIDYDYHDEGYEQVSYGTGRYGYGGSNLFCRLGCAYDWAVRKVSQEAVSQSLTDSLGTIVTSARQVREHEGE